MYQIAAYILICTCIRQNTVLLEFQFFFNSPNYELNTVSFFSQAKDLKFNKLTQHRLAFKLVKFSPIRVQDF